MLNKNEVVIKYNVLNQTYYSKFLIDTDADFNLIQISAVKNVVPIKMISISLQGIHETPI